MPTGFNAPSGLGNRRYIMRPFFGVANAQFVYGVTGSWIPTTTDSAPFYNYQFTTTNPSGFKYRFRGRVFGFVSWFMDGGIVQVSVDGGVAVNVDLYNATSNRTICATTFITHTDLDDDVHEAVFTVNSKNALASGYRFEPLAAVVDDSNVEWPKMRQFVMNPSSADLNVTVGSISNPVNIGGRQTASETGLWNNVAVTALGVSAAVAYNNAYQEYRVNVIASVPTTITVQYQVGTTWRNSAAASEAVVLTTGDLEKSLTFRPSGATAWRLVAKDPATITAGYSAAG